jgi:hypothetical protein
VTGGLKVKAGEGEGKGSFGWERRGGGSLAATVGSSRVDRRGSGE